LSTVASGS